MAQPVSNLRDSEVSAMTEEQLAALTEEQRILADQHQACDVCLAVEHCDLCRWSAKQEEWPCRVYRSLTALSGWM